MKDYYFSLSTDKQDGLGWDTAPQYVITSDNWGAVMIAAKTLSHVNRCEVRICESKGYNNQGAYIYHVGKPLIF